MQMYFHLKLVHKALKKARQFELRKIQRRIKEAQEEGAKKKAGEEGAAKLQLQLSSCKSADLDGLSVRAAVAAGIPIPDGMTLRTGGARAPPVQQGQAEVVEQRLLGAKCVQDQLAEFKRALGEVDAVFQRMAAKAAAIAAGEEEEKAKAKAPTPSGGGDEEEEDRERGTPPESSPDSQDSEEGDISTDPSGGHEDGSDNDDDDEEEEDYADVDVDALFARALGKRPPLPPSAVYSALVEQPLSLFGRGRQESRERERGGGGGGGGEQLGAPGWGGERMASGGERRRGLGARVRPAGGRTGGGPFPIFGFR